MTKLWAPKALDALVLAGGKGSRMGGPKALIPLGNTTLLGATLARLRPMFRRVMVVARQREVLAGLEAEILTDDRPEQGPLVGLARGLAASNAPWCFVTGCDMPFLNPAVIGLMAENLAGCEILVPSLDGKLQPLHAFYSLDCLPRARDLLDNGVVSMVALLSRCQTRTMAASDFRDLDPGLRSFMDVDTQDDYRAVQELSEGFL